MKTISRFLFSFIFASALALAQKPLTVQQVIDFVNSQIKLKGDDRATADYLRGIKLTQKLEIRDVEDLQGKGAGVRTLQALRKLSDDSASLPSAPPPAAPPPPRPAPSAADQTEILAAMREYALNYTKNLPNYVCVQTTRREIDPTAPGYASMSDRIQELLTFSDGKESYKVESVDGKSQPGITHEKLGGVVTSGEFGSMLNHIFDPQSGTDFQWERWATLRGKLMYVFAYSVPQAHGYSMYHGESKRDYTSAYKGLVYADVQSRAVMEIQMETVGIPADFAIKNVTIKLDYRPTMIADREYVLPYHFELKSSEIRASSKNEADYQLYRKFGAESSISFGDADPIPEDQLKEQPVPASPAAPSPKSASPKK